MNTAFGNNEKRHPEKKRKWKKNQDKATSLRCRFFISETKGGWNGQTFTNVYVTSTKPDAGNSSPQDMMIRSLLQEAPIKARL